MLRIAIVLIVAGNIAAPARAADAYPSRPIRLVAPPGAGAVTDILARILAERMRSSLGQQVVVDNRPGAGGIVGSGVVAEAARPMGRTWEQPGEKRKNER